MFSWYKYLIVSLVFSHLGFWSGSIFLIAPFPDLCLLVRFTIHTGIVRFLVLAFFDVLSRNCLEIVGKRVSAHFKLKSYRARAMAVRSPYDFLRSPYDSRTMLGVRTILINL